MVDSDHSRVIAEIENFMGKSMRDGGRNLAWLKTRMHPYFFFCNSEDVEAVSVLATDLHLLERNRRFTLADNEKNLIIAQLGVPGALYEALSVAAGEVDLLRPDAYLLWPRAEHRFSA